MAQDKLEKLRAKREGMTAKIRQELGRDRARQRRLDTRRKILAGALVLTEEDPGIKAWLSRTVAKALTRDDERALFGLAPLPAEPSAPQKGETRGSFGKLPPGTKATDEDISTGGSSGEPPAGR